MALTQRLQIRQSQALVMTPQLMQAIKLLQLSNLDLVAYVEAELERNPLLDRSAEDEGPADKPSDATAAPDEPSARGEAWNEGEGPPNGHAIDERLDISRRRRLPRRRGAKPPADLRASGRIFRMGGSRHRRPR